MLNFIALTFITKILRKNSCQLISTQLQTGSVTTPLACLARMARDFTLLSETDPLSDSRTSCRKASIIHISNEKHEAYLELDLNKYTFCRETGIETIEDLVCCEAISNALLPPIKLWWEVFM